MACETYTATPLILSLKWSSKFGQRAKMYPTQLNG